MNYSIFRLALTSFAFGSYLFLWYQGEMVPTWHAALWVFVALLTDLEEYLNNR